MEIFCKNYNCIHNNREDVCVSNRITVMGEDAQTSNGTTCDTFTAHHDFYTFEFASELFFESEEITTTKVIDCQVNNCKFNYNGKCRAESVMIDNIHARCQTFKLDS